MATGVLGLTAGVGAGLLGTQVGVSAASIRYVSPAGKNVGNCTNSAKPCATIQYAVNQAVAGDTVKVAAGSYHQTVQITKAVAVVGAGETRSTIDGHGLNIPKPYFGVVYFGAVKGAASITGFTITNPFPYTYTGGEPAVVGLADPNAGATVKITGNVISEGTYDTKRGSDFPIGVDGFRNRAHTTLGGNVIEGTFQGVLLEDNGPLALQSNVFSSLIPNKFGKSTYPPEGGFIFADSGNSLTGQNANGNSFRSYAGYGLILEAGYNTGSCSSSSPCNGSVSGNITYNSFALGGSGGAIGIVLQSEYSGSNLTSLVKGNQGYVTSPDHAISVFNTGGGSSSVTLDDNNITVRP